MDHSTLEAEFEPATVDRILSALAHEYNRSVVHYFRGASASVVSLDALADYVATVGTSSDLATSDQVALRLHHAGLPKLADAGIIEYDPQARTVRGRDHLLLETGELLGVA